MNCPEKINNNFIIENLKKIFNDKLSVILNEISDDYQLNKEKLVKKYIDDSFDIDFSTASIKKEKENKINYLQKMNCVWLEKLMDYNALEEEETELNFVANMHLI